MEDDGFRIYEVKYVRKDGSVAVYRQKHKKSAKPHMTAEEKEAVMRYVDEIIAANPGRKIPAKQFAGTVIARYPRVKEYFVRRYLSNINYYRTRVPEQVSVRLPG